MKNGSHSSDGSETCETVRQMLWELTDNVGGICTAIARLKQHGIDISQATFYRHFPTHRELDPLHFAAALQIICCLSNEEENCLGRGDQASDVIPIVMALAIEQGVATLSLDELTFLCLYAQQMGGRMNPWSLMVTLDMIRGNIKGTLAQKHEVGEDESLPLQSVFSPPQSVGEILAANLEEEKISHTAA